MRNEDQLGGGLLVHEWLGTPGGSERVFERMAQNFPSADIRCLWNDDPGLFSERNVTETFLARTPLRRNKAMAVPVMPLAWSVPTRRRYRWALVSSHSFAHHVRVRSGTSGLQTIVYTHTPARYIWEPELDGRASGRFARLAGMTMRGLDRRSAQRPDYIVANSNFVRDRIARHWKRDAEVLYPPVEVDLIQGAGPWKEKLQGQEIETYAGLPDEFILGASRFIDYKRLDLAIRAGELCDLPVVIAGWGPLEADLRKLADSSPVRVEVVARPSDELMFALYEAAQVLVFPPIEDFGMMPVEAMAAGTPVVVNNQGGAPESVSCPDGGQTFDGSESDLKRATMDALQMDRGRVAQHARKFRAERFDSQLQNIVRSAVC